MRSPIQCSDAFKTYLTMSVVPLTLTISLCLVFTFVIFFLREQCRQEHDSAESNALLPLSDETPRAADHEQRG